MTTTPQAVIDTVPPKRRWRGRVIWTLLILLTAFVVGGELFARFYLGLGDPPLSIADPEIEYLFAPDQRVSRFGNTITYNGYSMRATPDFPPAKIDPRELRILVMGDSVINGGALSDDSRIATTLVQQHLHADLGRPVLVMNASAGSWGPPNLLAYVKRHGFFDADVVVFVFNSGDYDDVPTWASIVGTPAFPDRKPVLALQEAVTRYLPRYLGRPTSADPTAAQADPDPAAIAEGIAAVNTLLTLSREGDRQVLMVLHLDRREAQAEPFPGHYALRQAAESAGVSVLDLGPSFRAALQAGEQPYRDSIHLNDSGQAIVAREILTALMSIDLAKQGASAPR
jgi:hypothetical protein